MEAVRGGELMEGGKEMEAKDKGKEKG